VRVGARGARPARPAPARPCRRRAGAHRAVRLDSRQPSSTEVSMRLIRFADSRFLTHREVPQVISRRTLIAGAVATFSASSLAHGQQPRRIPRIGVLWHAGSAEEESPYFGSLIEGLRNVGYIEGRNIALEHRFPDE